MRRGLSFTTDQLHMFIIWLIVILDYNFFYLISQPAFLQKINSKSTKTLIGLIVLILFINVVFNRLWIMYKYRVLSRILVLMFGSVVSVAILSYFHYSEQGIMSTARLMLPFFIPLLSLPILSLLENGYTWDDIIKPVKLAVFIWYLVSIVAYIYYNRYGTTFLINFYSEGEITTRGETIRMAMFSFGNIGLVYNLYRLLNLKEDERGKLWYFTNVLLGLFCVYVIQQTRMFFLADAVAMILVLLFSGGSQNKRIRNIVIIGIVLMALLQTNAISNLANSILYGDATHSVNSTEVRIDAIAYYWNEFLKNPLYALGFVSEAKYPSIVHGALGSYNFSDVGFVGLLAQTGIFSVFIFVIPMIRVLYIAGRVWIRGYAKQYSILIAVAIQCLILSISINLTHPAYIQVLPFLYAGYEYVWDKIKREENESAYELDYASLK